MTMQAGILGNDQEVNWDQLIYAPNPDAYAPIQFTSSAEASLPSAQPIDYGYDTLATATYSYAQAKAPDLART